MSPMPGRSTLITSAPNQASNCVHVGPDCTWVKSRMRTPLRAFPSMPHPMGVGCGRASGVGADFVPGTLLTTLRFTGVFLVGALGLMLLLFQCMGIRLP